ncbi:Cytochrome c-like domain [Pseudocohnilembus persalinus]|uniref:Cytochrome c-like domain n=1 Tax=Pseudocohnilembus persalinus TaxID=266149 RepID=A0A0V0QWR7_PSEPJ|nr:Cytochrome c-like domain [Pseudocohnilembus persalinus]|eukprot:KRX06525.1 Cytochrome c-like domain [Pseudocohnilembus persalinus]
MHNEAKGGKFSYNDDDFDEKWEQSQKPAYLKEVDPEEARKKWSHKIYSYSGKTKAEQDAEKDILLEEIQEQHIKGKYNYYKKLKQQDKLNAKAHEYLTKDITSKDIPVDGDFVEGSQVYMRNCSGCHSLESNTQAKKTTGPALGLIYGKKSGSDNYYKDYSDTLLNSRLIWNQITLFSYLSDTKKFMKGTRCDAKIESEEERSDLITFMKLYSKNLAINLRKKADKIYGKEFVSVQLQTQKLVDDEAAKKLRNL